MDFLKTLSTPSPIFPNDANCIVAVKSDSALGEAFQKLIDYHLQALPVCDFTTGQVLGFISTLDIVVHVLDITGQTEESPEGDYGGFLSLLTERELLRSIKVRDVMGKAHESLVVVGEHDKLDKVVQALHERKAHRAVALNGSGQLVNVIAQSRIVECINELWNVDPTITAAGTRSIGELGIATRDVITIEHTRPAIQAFRMLREHGVSGVAVVRKEGGRNVLVGNVSSHDLGLIKSTGSFFKLLYAPLDDYLQGIRSVLPSHAPASKGLFPTLTKCTNADLFKDVVDRMVKSAVHRCYVVDEQDGVLGVLSLTDIVGVLVGKH